MKKIILWKITKLISNTKYKLTIYYAKIVYKNVIYFLNNLNGILITMDCL